MISVVIPTYNEASAIQETLRRAAAALRSSGEEFEFIVVDDSSADGTADLAEVLKDELPVRVLRRPGRIGLATAVLDGWKLARGDLLGVMDGDLQHPPEALPALAASLRTSGADLAIASRYVAGGSTSDWSWRRRFVSWGATHLAASVLPWALVAVTDPMSGMFLIRAAALKDVPLDPVGYKVLLEVLAKARYRSLIEVPYVFEQRGRGSSKLGARQYGEYLLHLARLARSTGQLRAWIRYGVVGVIGAAVNLIALFLLVERAAWRPGQALPVAIQLALFSNFFWNDTLTFRASRAGERCQASILSRLLSYEKVCVPGAFLNGLMTLVLVREDVPLLLAAAMGVFAGGLWNLLFNVPTIWRIWGKRSSPKRVRAA